jgi:hypothetical protein
MLGRREDSNSGVRQPEVKKQRWIYLTQFRVTAGAHFRQSF